MVVSNYIAPMLIIRVKKDSFVPLNNFDKPHLNGKVFYCEKYEKRCYLLVLWINLFQLVLQCATKKRPTHPPSLLASDPRSEEKTKYKSLLAEQLAKVLVKKNMGSISDYALHCLVYEIAKTTELDDGSLCPPPDEPPPEPEPEPTPAVSSLHQSFQPQTGSGSVSSMV